jgi:hypothetical protein
VGPCPGPAGDRDDAVEDRRLKRPDPVALGGHDESVGLNGDTDVLDASGECFADQHRGNLDRVVNPTTKEPTLFALDVVEGIDACDVIGL